MELDGELFQGMFCTNLAQGMLGIALNDRTGL
jgi:hypothetical protein